MQFKRGNRYHTKSPVKSNFKLGDFVIVEADRGVDLGIITHICRRNDLLPNKSDRKFDGKDYKAYQLGRIIRMATPTECAFLPEKHRQESEILDVCKDLAQRIHRLPISVVNVVYQFDRNKLTIFYSSIARVDFREFVRDLFGMCDSRIWMEKVLFSSASDTEFNRFATALESGIYRSPKSSFAESGGGHGRGKNGHSIPNRTSYGSRRGKGRVNGAAVPMSDLPSHVHQQLPQSFLRHLSPTTGNFLPQTMTAPSGAAFVGLEYEEDDMNLIDAVSFQPYVKLPYRSFD